jgi:hypothetical protein
MLRSDAGLLGVAVNGRAGPRGRSRHVLALVAGVALALSVGAVTATSASAFSVLTACEIDVGNETGYAMQMYSQDVHGFKDDWAKPSEDDSSVITYSAGSLEPAYNHCSIDLRFQLQTPDGSGWSQGLETYVYDPNSGHNNAFANATGDFAQRTCVTTTPNDYGAGEVLDVSVDPGPCVSCPIYPCFGTNSATRLSAGGDPLSRAGDAARRLPRPKQVPSLLRRGDLTGRGWGRATRPGDLGHLGRVLLAAKVPASCRDKNKESLPSPLREGASAFSRRGGAEFIGAGHGIYANARQSRRTIDDAVSTQSIGCFARLLTSKRFHTTVSTKRLSVTLAGRRLIFNRLKVSTHSGARITRTDYIDLTGVQHGKANALLIFASDKRHPDARGVAAAIGAVAGRLP